MLLAEYDQINLMMKYAAVYMDEKRRRTSAPKMYKRGVLSLFNATSEDNYKVEVHDLKRDILNTISRFNDDFG